MKKIFFVLFLCSSFLFLSTSAFAQSSADNRAWIDEKYKEIFPYGITVGGYGFYDYSNLGYGANGGGFSINGKINFLRWLGVALDFSYAHTTSIISRYSNNTNSLGTFLFSPMVVFQRETPRGRIGSVPWVAIGFSVANNKVSPSNLSSYTGLGFILATGFRYNLPANVYVGGRMDYSTSGYYGELVHNWRIGVEVGYRF